MNMTIENILTSYRNGSKVSNNDLTKLYEEAKEAYYNGVQIMEDFEFDALEAELGLENKAYVGTKHNPKYTVKHPFVMGSLSKVQIHKTKEGTINWTKHFGDVLRFVSPNVKTIITPKFDGCSFEAVINGQNILDISSRGDGLWGKDYKKHLQYHIADAIKGLNITNEVSLRGEVLIKKDVFMEKYSEFVNPRSFVSGILNRDYDENVAEICKDLSIVIYDVRINEEGNWIDNDWTILSETMDSKYLPQFCINGEEIENESYLENVYNVFADYRNDCPFALDGIVIKPVDSERVNNLTEHRPEDCVAIKFIPMLEETEVIRIDWNLGKSGEYVPVVITKPVIMDGKSVSRAKANNIGYLLSNKISVGTKLVFSLAGDIIPFIYKVTNTDNFDENKLDLPEGNTKVDGIHLMAVLSDEEKRIEDLRNSIITLNLNGMGLAGVNTIVDYMKTECAGDDFFGIEPKPLPNNVFFITSDIFEKAIGGKTGTKVKKDYDKVLKDLDLKTVIRSCNFRLCGDKVATQIVNYLIGEKYDFSSMAREAYGWVMDNNSKEMTLINNILNFVGYTIEDFKKKNEEFKNSAAYKATANQIPVILTGEPNDYKSKGEFLKCHPEYRMTGSWKEVKIVFTNDMNSNTGKMKNAKVKGIEIRLY